MMFKHKNRLQNKPFSRPDLLFLAFFLLVSLFIFWKCRYGFGNIDECFYLTVPYRLLQGDALIQEEWHLSQMAGVLTMPLVSAYLRFNGSTEGIILAMRYVWTAIQCCTAVFLYLQLRRLNWLGALLSSLSYLLFTPFGLMAMSYNSMGLQLIVISSVLMLTAAEKARVPYILAGLCFAGAVLCCPYLLLVFALYLAAVACRFAFLRYKKTVSDSSCWSIRAALLISAGSAAAAALFLAFVLSRSSLSGIISSISPMLNDPEHPPIQWILKTKGYIVFMLRANPWAKYIYAALALIGAAYLVDCKRELHRNLYTGLYCIGVLVLMYSFHHFNQYINHIMWPVNVLAVFILLMTRDFRIRKVFFTVWIPGILYSYCVYMGSNQEFYSISSAGAAASVGSMAMVGMYLCEILHTSPRFRLRKPALILVGLFIIVQFGIQTLYRYHAVIWDNKMEELTTAITDGVEKGVYTTEEKYNTYYQDLSIISQLKKYRSERFLHLSEKTWYYLHVDAENAAYSAWLSGVNEHTVAKLQEYYAINPQKMPDVVFVDADYQQYADLFCEQFSYRAEVIDGGIVLIPQ